MEIQDITQWHPAFCSAVELELRENKKSLIYEREYNLGKMPLKIDLLIIKKKPNETIKNEIGAFFRGSNLIEYKSPDDKVNIDTFYKVLSYACLYKSETGSANEIKDTDITITLMRESKPEKLLNQLAEKYSVACGKNGIYYVHKMLFPLQIIVTNELDDKNHIWLKALTKSLSREQAVQLINDCSELCDKNDRLNAEAVMNLVADKNEEIFERILKEDELMTDRLKQLIEPELVGLRIMLRNKDAELADKDAKLADKDAEIAGKDAKLADKDAEIADKDAEIADKDAEIANKDAKIADKDAEIADKDAEIADKDAEIADKDAEIADKDAEIALLKKQLAEAQSGRNN